MKKTQWIIFGAAILSAAVLFAATQKRFFGSPKMGKAGLEPSASGLISVDSILFHAKEQLKPDQVARINFLEHSITRGDVKDQKLHIYHQLASFWKDSANLFDPFAWYTAEAARLENSEKSLTFAAHLFLNNLGQTTPQLKQWRATQAKDLFERSLNLNPSNDSSKVGLGAIYVYGGVAMPMQGINMIKEVADKDPKNLYAQWTLAQASIMSGQLDKALERLKIVTQLDPKSIEVYLLGAGVLEQMGKKSEAIDWYNKVLPLVSNSEIKKEIEARIAELKK